MSDQDLYLREIARASKAASIRELCHILSEWVSSPNWTCDYSQFPVWGPMTDSVRERIHASSEMGDLISWDTTDLKNPLYLMRVFLDGHFKCFVDEGD